MTSIQKTTTRLLMAGIVCAATLAGCASSETRPPARAHATLPPLVAITETMTTTTLDERDEPPITTAVIPPGPTPAQDNAGAAPLPTETTVELAGRTRPRLTPSVETRQPEATLMHQREPTQQPAPSFLSYLTETEIDCLPDHLETDEDLIGTQTGTDAAREIEACMSEHNQYLLYRMVAVGRGEHLSDETHRCIWVNGRELQNAMPTARHPETNTQAVEVLTTGSTLLRIHCMTDQELDEREIDPDRVDRADRADRAYMKCIAHQAGGAAGVAIQMIEQGVSLEKIVADAHSICTGNTTGQ